MESLDELQPSFNPRSRTGNDRLNRQCRAGRSRFQSTFPHGERQIHRLHLSSLALVSIHVPARGTTKAGDHMSIRDRPCFNPRSRTGNDSTYPRCLDDQALFQSTFPHGERPERLIKDWRLLVVSIHVPARGTTSTRLFALLITLVSIHVPARGTTITARTKYRI